jgi:HAD superfamily hydrolase (TIGR01509 family)
MDGMRSLGLSPSEGRNLMEMLNDALTSVEFNALETVKPMPNALETLETLKNRGIKIGVATRSGAAYAKRCLEKTGLSSLVDVVLARDEVEKPKPHPDHLLQVIEMLGTTPERVIYVGDSTTDLNTAKEAGVRFLGFWWSDERVGRMKDAGCKLFIKDLWELLDHT